MLIWLLVLAYTMFIHGQQRKLEQELVLLQELLEERGGTNNGLGEH